jgi:glycosyltransferase involved in cell wall biosynthesis
VLETKWKMSVQTVPINVVVPAFNEARSVGKVVQRVKELFPHAIVVVVNDGSTDDTGGQASRAGATVVNLPFNSGYGVALHTGLIWARRNNADIVVTLDSDGQHDPGEIHKLLLPVLKDEVDLVLGSRYLPESLCGYSVPVARRFGSWVFAQLVSVIIGRRFTDPTSGFLCMNKKALDCYVNLPDFPDSSPDADMVLQAHFHNCRMKEAAVAMYADEGNDSMHGIWRSMFYVPKMLLAMLGIIIAAVLWRKKNP